MEEFSKTLSELYRDLQDGEVQELVRYVKKNVVTLLCEPAILYKSLYIHPSYTPMNTSFPYTHLWTPGIHVYTPYT